MTRTVDELDYPLRPASHGISPRWRTIGFGHCGMYWYRLLEWLGRNSLVGATVRDATWSPIPWRPTIIMPTGPARKVTSQPLGGGGCMLGVALTSSADNAHLQEADGEFAAAMRDFTPEYAPETVSTDDRAATQNAFRRGFPQITVVLCFVSFRQACKK